MARDKFCAVPTIEGAWLTVHLATELTSAKTHSSFSNNLTREIHAIAQMGAEYGRGVACMNVRGFRVWYIRKSFGKEFRRTSSCNGGCQQCKSPSPLL